MPEPSANAAPLKRQTRPWAGKLRSNGRPIASGYRHNENPPEGVEPGWRGSRCRCLGAGPAQQCWLDLTGPDGLCDACRQTCRPDRRNR